MKPETILLRQVHPNFRDKDGFITKQAFLPTPDDNKTSMDNGDHVTARESYENHRKRGKDSIGTWGVSLAEVVGVGLSAAPDPLPDQAEHCVIDYDKVTGKPAEKLAKRLRDHAAERNCLHDPNAAAAE